MDYVVGNCEFEAIELRFLLENGDTVLKVRHADVCYHSPLESANESSSQAGNFRRRAIAGQHDLPTCFIQSVKSVEKLFLGVFFSSLQEVNIIDKQQIGLAITAAKLCASPVENRADQLVHELLSSHISDASLWISQQCLVRNRLHEMGFPQTRVAVDKEGIVNLSWRLTYGVSRRRSELVGFPNDKQIKGVAIT